jgi:hypothetical protein
MVLSFVNNDGIAQHRLKGVIDLLGDSGPGPWAFSTVINKCLWSEGRNTNNFYAWDVVNYGYGQTGYPYSPELSESTWYKIEVAMKFSKGSDGFLWAAINGAVFCNYVGQTVHDSASNTKRDRYGILQTYCDFTGADPGLVATGLEVWEQWPSDATAHPGI